MLAAWLRHWHGIGEAHQAQFYRCLSCFHVVTWHQVRAGGCGRCSAARIRPTTLTLWEKVKALVMPWTL